MTFPTPESKDELDLQISKRCNYCGVYKHFEEFGRDHKSRDGHNNRCKSCVNKVAKENRINHPDRSLKSVMKYRKNHPDRNKESNRNSAYRSALKKEYGIEYNDYVKIFNDQGGLCAICGSDGHEGRGQKLHIDHDHKTNKVRGLLCDNCNRGLGCLKDDIEILRRSIVYLESQHGN